MFLYIHLRYVGVHRRILEKCDLRNRKLIAEIEVLQSLKRHIRTKSKKKRRAKRSSNAQNQEEGFYARAPGNLKCRGNPLPCRFNLLPPPPPLFYTWHHDSWIYEEVDLW